MPSYVPRYLEPYQKREILEKRLLSLRGAINSGASEARIANAAEKVRLAALAVIKTRRSQLWAPPTSEAGRHQLQNLDEDEHRWRSLSVEAIVNQASRPEP